MRGGNRRDAAGANTPSISGWPSLASLAAKIRLPQGELETAAQALALTATGIGAGHSSMARMSACRLASIAAQLGHMLLDARAEGKCGPSASSSAAQ
jgi:hypothetical protein